MPSHANNDPRLPIPSGRRRDTGKYTSNEDEDVITIQGTPIVKGQEKTATKRKKEEDGDYVPESHVPGTDQAKSNGRPKKRPKPDLLGDQTDTRTKQSQGEMLNPSEDGAPNIEDGLHPVKETLTFYKKEGVGYRKAIKELKKQVEERELMVGNQQQINLEMQTRVTSLEEALLDRTKVGTGVTLDIGRVREAFEKISKMCKDWAMEYRRSGTLEKCLEDTDSRLVYSTLLGKKYLKRQLISTEGKDLLWKHNAGIYSLLHALIYHSACTDVLEDWLFFIKADGKSPSSRTFRMLEGLFDEARHEDNYIANQWRFLSIKMLKLIREKPHTGVNADLSSQDRAFKDRFYQTATAKVLGNVVVRVFLRDIDAAGEVERHRELVAIFRRAGAVGLQLWCQGFVIETGGTSEADFARVFKANDPLRRPHSVMKLGDTDTSLDGTKVCLVLQPTILGKQIALESLDQKPTVYSQSLVLALKPTVPPAVPRAEGEVNHGTSAEPGTMFAGPASPTTPAGQDEWLSTYQSALRVKQPSRTPNMIGSDPLPIVPSSRASGTRQATAPSQTNDGVPKAISSSKGDGQKTNSPIRANFTRRVTIDFQATNHGAPKPTTSPRENEKTIHSSGAGIVFGPGTEIPTIPGLEDLPLPAQKLSPKKKGLGDLGHAHAPQDVDHCPAEESLRKPGKLQVVEESIASGTFTDQLKEWASI